MAEADEDHVVVTLNGRTCEISRSVAETVSVTADPSPAAAHGAARAARALQGPLRALVQLSLDLVDEVEMQVHEAAQEAVHQQQVLGAVG